VAAQAVEARMQPGDAVLAMAQFDLARRLAVDQQEHAPGAGQQQRQAVATIVEQALGRQTRRGLQQFVVPVHTSLNTSSKRFSASSTISSLSAALVYSR